MSDLYRIEWPKAKVPEDESWVHSVTQEIQYAIDNDVLIPVTLDPEDVIEDWLIDHGVDEENAYNIGHHLTHSVLYSVARAVKCAVLDAALGGDDD